MEKRETKSIINLVLFTTDNRRRRPKKNEEKFRLKSFSRILEEPKTKQKLLLEEEKKLVHH